MTTTSLPFVEETRFGNWFLNTETWKIYVLCRALDDLQRLMPVPAPKDARILDIGCGFGQSFDELARRFSPQEIVAIDAEEGLQARAGQRAADCPCKVSLQLTNAASLDFADHSFDLLVCHQTLHHIVDQEAALAEFLRVLKPGGMLLMGESTRAYIHSLAIKLLFRHPMHVQRTAEEYIAMVRAAGFDLPQPQISFPYLWWSRPDLGLLERWGFPPPKDHEETLLNLVALKPL